MIALLGSLIVLASVTGGFLMAGGNLLLLWHPSEIVVILGAALGAFITSNSMKVVKSAFAGALGLVKPMRYNRDSYVELLKLVFDLLVKSRKEGLLAIENDIADPAKSPLFSKYPKILEDHHMIEFITDCMRLMVGGNLDPNELESLLDYELETHHKEAHEPAHAVQTVADALPGFGIVAAVLGIVNTMAAVADSTSAELGEKVGAALVGTFLGILVAYGFVGPISSAMKARAEEEGKAFEVVKMALVASVRGYPPQVAVEFARKLLFSDVRPTFSDLEGSLKNKPKADAAKT
ncbi:MAG: flagellar motor stator protein MotA [Gammaproteobacteria bacterium]|jgi:chemotaxis protein MotA|nr:flagellar motor stator protein MotA [Gammaproteobacteria bacterium]